MRTIYENAASGFWIKLGTASQRAAEEPELEKGGIRGVAMKNSRKTQNAETPFQRNLE